jgi:beta-lactamase superfamily II metal-dependent hydrolase
LIMNDEAALLQIHVLGAGEGESVVLGLPGGQWGVVDCYSPSLSEPSCNPTLQFLNERDIHELEFLCLTHPHKDHFHGMSQLLQNLDVHAFWRFGALSGRHFVALAEYLAVDAEGRHAEAEDADEFVRIIRLVRDKRIPETRIGARQQLYPPQHDVRAPLQIWGFAPSGRQIARYERRLEDCFTSDGLLKSTSSLPQVRHNIVSAGIMVIYGNTRVVLGGDIEKAGWNDAMEEFPEEWFAASAVKVSHHGSTNGYAENLWQTLALNGKPIAVLAPYRKQGLPDSVALDEIERHSTSVLTTSASALNESVFSADAPLASRLAIHDRFKAEAEAETPGCGCCSLFFDQYGNCLEQVVDASASRIPAE